MDSLRQRAARSAEVTVGLDFTIQACCSVAVLTELECFAVAAIVMSVGADFVGISCPFDLGFGTELEEAGS